MITTIVILSIILAVSILVNINQLRKQESQSDYIEDLEKSNTEQYTFVQQFKVRIGEVNSRIRQVDRIGSFEAADETGFIFKELRDIVEELNKGF